MTIKKQVILTYVVMFLKLESKETIEVITPAQMTGVKKTHSLGLGKVPNRLFQKTKIPIEKKTGN